jgi:hypothetical protein
MDWGKGRIGLGKRRHRYSVMMATSGGIRHKSGLKVGCGFANQFGFGEKHGRRQKTGNAESHRVK